MAKQSKGAKNSPNIIFFYGKECTWCHKMMPHVEQVEKELGITVKRLEVWHNSANAKKLQDVDNDRCGGVPFMINTKTNDFLCGYSPVSAIKKLCGGKP